MDPASALAAFQAALAELQDTFAQLQSMLPALDWSWPVFAFGMISGILAGVIVPRVCRRRRDVPKRRTFVNDLLALTPALVACLLWGVWLGILAAKSLSH